MGLSPQLTLEAAILREGGFDDIDAGSSVSRAGLCPAERQQSAGRAQNAGIEDQARATSRSRPIRPPTMRAQQLEKLIRKFEDEDQAYTSLNLSMWTARYGAYDDLARIKEWSAAGGLGIEEW